GDDEALQGGLQSPRRMSAAAHSVPRADRTLLRVPGNDRVPRRRVPLAAGPLTLRSVLHSARAARRYDVPAAVHHDEVDAGAPREPADEDDDVLHAHLHDGDLPAVRVRAEPVLRVAEHCLDSAADPADARAVEVACVEEVNLWREFDARSRWRIANGPGTLGGGGFVSLSRAVRWYCRSVWPETSRAPLCGGIPRCDAGACVGVRSVSGKVGALAQATGRVASAARFTRRSETCPEVTRRPAVHRRAARRVRAADPGRGGRACGRRRPGRLPSRLRLLRLPG